MIGVHLNDSAPGVTTTAAAPSTSNSNSSSGFPPLLSAYWYSRINVSRPLSDLSLVLLITVTSPLAPFPSEQLPMQLSFAPDFYPALCVDTPLGCPNATDLLGGGKSRKNSSKEEQVTQVHLRSWGDGNPQSSCWPLMQQWPSFSAASAAAASAGMPLPAYSSSPTSFKLFFHPSFLQGFLNRSDIAPSHSPSSEEHAEEEQQKQIPVYFSLYHESETTVDVSAWFQGNLDILSPVCPATGCPKMQ